MKCQVSGKEGARTVSITAPTPAVRARARPVRAPNGPQNPERTDI
jgi:hypothetical protein